MPDKAVFSTKVPALLQSHYLTLSKGSGLSVQVIRERAYRSITHARDLAEFGFTASQQRAPGLLLPAHAPDGSNSLYLYRPDHPRQTKSGKALKYEFPKNARMRLDVPPRCLAALGDPAVPLWMTEGQKKADALAARGLAAAALLGVWNFKGRNEFGGVTLLADFDSITLKNRTVNVVFDSDVMIKRSVQEALARLTEHLTRREANVNAIYLPSGANGEKVGVDDFLLNHSVTELTALIGAPRPLPAPTAPTLELLDEPPPAITRPLDLINGAAYAAIWPHLRRTITEILGKDGEIVRLNPPRVETIRELHIVRGDGEVFGPGARSKLGGSVSISSWASLPAKRSCGAHGPSGRIWRNAAQNSRHCSPELPPYTTILWISIAASRINPRCANSRRAQAWSPGSLRPSLWSAISGR